MKKLDKLLIKSFLPPFVVTFFIALFVLIMQFLWTYIDEIIGKGAGFLIILELLAYLSMSLIPTALPIAILISSVMVMGNLAERYELASMKSAGIPLLRIMKPLMFVVSGIAVFSFLCSNYLIPLANLQFKSRLYDIRKQKPALNLEAGVFNEDFKGFVIHIGQKGTNNRDIEDVIIYDHTTGSKDPMHITAQRGEMFNTDDGNYFVMKLFDGTQYQESKSVTKGENKTYPFARTSFKQWNKIFDLSEFNIKETDTELFDDHYTMLSIEKLYVKIDSLELKIDERFKKLRRHTHQYVSILKTAEDSAVVEKNRKENIANSKMQLDEPKKDSVRENQQVRKVEVLNDSIDRAALLKQQKALTDSLRKESEMRLNKKPNVRKNKNYGKKIIAQKIDKPLAEYDSILETFTSDKERRNIISKAVSYSRNVQSQAKSSRRSIDKYQEGLVKHIFELNIKFSMALICFIFLFIGAPMGAIIRKGGFGYPLLIAITFFMLYIVLNIFCKKLAESQVLDPIAAAWLPCMILFPLGLLLTYKAMNDSKLLDIDKYTAVLLKFLVGRKVIESAMEHQSDDQKKT